MSDDVLLVETDDRGVCTVTMNRPDRHNAFDDALIRRLMLCFRDLATRPEVRVAVLTGAGKSFSAGADVNWMRRMAGYSRGQNFEDAMGLADMLKAIATCPKPTIAKVNGPAYGGGVGLAAVCDVCVAGPSAAFALSEVRLGIIPAAISPYVVEAMGLRAFRRYFLTGERFDVTEAYRLGLVHAAPSDLDAGTEAIVGALLEGGPKAQAAAKDLIGAVAHRVVDDHVIRDTAGRIADIRVSPEGQEGLGAFLEKRPAKWRG